MIFSLTGYVIAGMQQQHALETEETCTQYNMLKIARYLFQWTGNVSYADYYERAILNGLLGTQRMPASHEPQPLALPQYQATEDVIQDDHQTHEEGQHVDTTLQKEVLQLPGAGATAAVAR